MSRVMARTDLTKFKGITFDIIGTLIDFEAGILDWCRPRLPTELTDNEILEIFAHVEKALHVRLYYAAVNRSSFASRAVLLLQGG